MWTVRIAGHGGVRRRPVHRMWAWWGARSTSARAPVGTAPRPTASARSRTRPALLPDRSPATGERDGHVHWAQLDVSEDAESLLCHECGQWNARWAPMPGTGVASPPCSTADDTGCPQVSRSRCRPSQACFAAIPQAQEGSTGRRSLEAHRDPDRARAAMTDEGQHRAQLRATRAAPEPAPAKAGR